MRSRLTSWVTSVQLELWLPCRTKQLEVQQYATLATQGGRVTSSTALPVRTAGNMIMTRSLACRCRTQYNTLSVGGKSSHSYGVVSVANPLTYLLGKGATLEVVCSD